MSNISYIFWLSFTFIFMNIPLYFLLFLNYEWDFFFFALFFLIYGNSLYILDHNLTSALANIFASLLVGVLSCGEFWKIYFFIVKLVKFFVMLKFFFFFFILLKKVFLNSKFMSVLCVGGWGWGLFWGVAKK